MSKTNQEKKIKKLEKIIEDKTTSINEMAEQMATLDIEIHHLKNIAVNDEKKIAQAILDAQKMRDESYDYHSGTEGYALDIEECLQVVCANHGLSENLWYLLDLAMHWWNDIQLWAEDVLAGKNILEECEKENAKMKDKIKQVGEIVDELTDNDNEKLMEELTKMNDTLKAEKEKTDCPCEHKSKEACDQCQETGIAKPDSAGKANPNNYC